MKAVKEGWKMSAHIRAAALGNEPADLLFKNGQVVDVITGSVYEADVAVADGVIAGVGSYDKAYKTIDLRGSFSDAGPYQRPLSC